MDASTSHGPPGIVRKPSTVILLGIVTLGIYILVWQWRATREIEAFTQGRFAAHAAFKRALLMLVGIFVGYGVLFGGLAAGSQVIFLVGLLAVLTAGIASIVYGVQAVWRLLKAIESDERARASPNPLSPGLVIALWVIPYVNFITGWIALHKVQTAMNGMWTAATGRAGTPPVPPAPPPPARMA